MVDLVGVDIRLALFSSFTRVIMANMRKKVKRNIGCWLLVVGSWLLVAGWSLVSGSWFLVIG